MQRQCPLRADRYHGVPVAQLLLRVWLAGEGRGGEAMVEAGSVAGVHPREPPREKEVLINEEALHQHTGTFL